ncbi:MAG: hypothetical protein ACI853_002187 [Paracoccaceae bacterium]|jgi:hypothetical protein
MEPAFFVRAYLANGWNTRQTTTANTRLRSSWARQIAPGNSVLIGISNISYPFKKRYKFTVINIINCEPTNKQDFLTDHTRNT